MRPRAKRPSTVASIRSAYALRYDPKEKALPTSRAARVDMVMNLLGLERQYDEYGNFIGYSPQLISREQALEALGLPKLL